MSVWPTCMNVCYHLGTWYLWKSEEGKLELQIHVSHCVSARIELGSFAEAVYHSLLLGRLSSTSFLFIREDFPCMSYLTL